MSRSKSTYSLLVAVIAFTTAGAVAQCCAPQVTIDYCNAKTPRLYWSSSACNCICSPTPIIVDVDGHGFHLTSPENGVNFDLNADGAAERVAWTSPGWNNAFLVLDRNGNGIIDNGAELFGDHAPQPKSDHPNGFLALAQYDRADNGGNEDDVIDSRDAIFSKLRLWIDANHDGVSQPDELFPLPTLGIYSISLEAQPTNRRDGSGNLFLYRAEVNDGILRPVRVAYDVYLAVQ